MTDLTDTFKQLEEHAREWLEFSRETYGWNTREYEEFVRCYFADATDHQDVRFGRYGSEISIAFHNPVKFNGLTYKSLASAQSILSAARELFSIERQHAAQRSESEVQAEREKQIEALRLRLAELEGGVALCAVAQAEVAA